MTGLALLAIAIIGILAARALWSKLQADQLRASGAVASGVVTDVIRDSVGGDQPDVFVVSYQFTPELSATVSKSEQLLNPRNVPSVGDKVVVRYDPRTPTNARIDLHGEVGAL